MFVLDALDATRICARSSAALADPEVWKRPVPVTRRRPSPVQGPDTYSWRSLVRNPHAMVVAGMVGTVMVKDVMLGILAGERHPSFLTGPT
jgi:hypothetical protein